MAEDRADLIVFGGRLFAPGRAGTAIAVKGERIVALGADRDVLPLRGPRTEVVDARGGTVLPGFNDAHLHLRLGSIALDRLDLFGLSALDDVFAAIADHAAARPDRAWVAGRGWLYATFPGGMPTRDQLDAVVPDRPAYLECFDGHSGWANTLALKAAGIDATTADPPDGRIVRDIEGRPTGVLLERATELVERSMPEPDAPEVARLVRDGLAALARAGITSAQDAWASIEDLAALRGIADAGGLPIRVRVGLEMVPGRGLDALEDELDRFSDALERHSIDGRLRGGILKSFSDGVVEARTASMLEPYPGTDTRGDPRWGDDELIAAVGVAHRRGWQVQLHAIGTAAVRQALDAYEALGPGEAAARRHRVEHIETLDPDDFPRFARLGVVASIQPFHAVPDAGQIELWSSRIGPLAASGWRLRSLLESGAHLAFGSDWPVVPFDPFLAMHGAVNRRTLDGRLGGGLLADEAISLEQALAAATIGSAYAEHAEADRGVLAPGMLADLVVLDRDLLAEGPSAILGTRPILTVVGGEVVHRAA